MCHPKSQPEEPAPQVSQERAVPDRFLTAWKRFQAKISSQWRDANQRIREPDAAAIPAGAKRQRLLNGDVAGSCITTGPRATRTPMCPSRTTTASQHAVSHPCLRAQTPSSSRHRVIPDSPNCYGLTKTVFVPGHRSLSSSRSRILHQWPSRLAERRRSCAPGTARCSACVTLLTGVGRSRNEAITVDWAR